MKTSGNRNTPAILKPSWKSPLEVAPSPNQAATATGSCRQLAALVTFPVLQNLMYGVADGQLHPHFTEGWEEPVSLLERKGAPYLRGLLPQAGRVGAEPP